MKNETQKNTQDETIKKLCVVIANLEARLIGCEKTIEKHKKEAAELAERQSIVNGVVYRLTTSKEVAHADAICENGIMSLKKLFD